MLYTQEKCLELINADKDLQVLYMKTTNKVINITYIIHALKRGRNVNNLVLVVIAKGWLQDLVKEAINHQLVDAIDALSIKQYNELTALQLVADTITPEQYNSMETKIINMMVPLAPHVEEVIFMCYPIYKRIHKYMSIYEFRDVEELLISLTPNQRASLVEDRTIKKIMADFLRNSPVLVNSIRIISFFPYLFALMFTRNAYILIDSIATIEIDWLIIDKQVLTWYSYANTYTGSRVLLHLKSYDEFIQAIDNIHHSIPELAYRHAKITDLQHLLRNFLTN